METNGLQTFEVESQTEASLIYLVRFHRDQRWSCSCADYLYRRARLGDACKHIARVIAQRESNGQESR